MKTQSEVFNKKPFEITEELSYRRRSLIGIIFGEFFTIRSAVAGIIVLFILVFLAVFAEWIAPYPYDQINPEFSYNPPSWEYPFGADKFGRDVLSRVIYGGQISLRIGLIATGIGGTLGLMLGMLAGFFGKWADNLIMRFMDVMLAFPGILLAMVIVAILGPNLQNLMIAVGLSSVPGYARLVRSTVLSVKEVDYVMAAHSIGSTDLRIMAKHIFPNITAPLIVYATLAVATAILSGASLSFLGLGAKPPTPEWGIMLSDGRNTLSRAWWVSFFPGMAISITSLAINFVGDGLRMALDPHVRGRD